MNHSGASSSLNAGASTPTRSGAEPPGAPARAEPLAVWMTSYRPELLRHLAGMLESADDAEDVLQQVWIRAHECPPHTGDGSNVRAWLYRVATNAALDRMARDRRRRGILSCRWSPPTPEADAPAVLQELSRRARDAVRKHTASLPPKQREAVWFRWVEECDYETIARRLDTSVDSARANVYQGLKRLRKELRDVWEQEQGL